MITGPFQPRVDTTMEIKTNWLNSIYGEHNCEEITTNPPVELGKTISVKVFVDASHAGEKLAYCSHTGILIYVNTTPVDWFLNVKIL